MNRVFLNKHLANYSFEITHFFFNQRENAEVHTYMFNGDYLSIPSAHR